MEPDSIQSSNDFTSDNQGHAPQSYFDRFRTPQNPQNPQQTQSPRGLPQLGKNGQPSQTNVVDIQQALRGQMGVLKGQSDTIKQQADELAALRQKTEQQGQFFDQMRGIFNPQQQETDPIAQEIADAEQQLDFYLQQAIEADKAGQPIPLTTNLAVNFFKQKIAAAEERRAHSRELSEMKRKLAMLTDPNVQIDTNAYGTIDNKITQFMTQLYGNSPDTMDVRVAQFNNIAGQIGQEIKHIQKSMPDVWDRVRRNPEEIHKMVAFFVEKNMPPRVRQQLEQENIQNTPMGMDELYQAFDEAAMIQDPKERADIRAKIRQEILSMSFDSQRSPRGGARAQFSRPRNQLGQFVASRGLSGMFG